MKVTFFLRPLSHLLTNVSLTVETPFIERQLASLEATTISSEGFRA